MSQALADLPTDWEALIESLVTEDDEPVDNLFSAKQQRLLARVLYSSWIPPLVDDGEQRKFLADTNVGVFYSPYRPPLVPDFFLSLDVEPHENWYAKEHRSYFIWEFGKAPEVAVEIVSNRKGGELGHKLQRYAQMDISYYVVYDPQRLLSDQVLQVFERGLNRRYQVRSDTQLPAIGLNLTLWQGEFEGYTDTWLRWCEQDGTLLLTGQERAVLEAAARQEAEQGREQEARARQEAEAHAARLAAKLRELGIDPEQT